ncbi:hypothetical protein [Chryseobacterium culicis]|jgi:hypothetical protein|nr:hypothetical protein [Chryseobacterium culicis]
MNEKLIPKVGNIHSAIYEYSHKHIQFTGISYNDVIAGLYYFG